MKLSTIKCAPSKINTRMMSGHKCPPAVYIDKRSPHGGIKIQYTEEKIRKNILKNKQNVKKDHTIIKLF